jgi:hypothetical protein
MLVRVVGSAISAVYLAAANVSPFRQMLLVAAR